MTQAEAVPDSHQTYDEPGPSGRRLRVACVQLNAGIDIPANIATASALIREAAAGGAKLIATPEMTSLMNHAPGALYASSQIEGEDRALLAFRALATELGVWLLIGSLHIREREGLCANRSFLLDSKGGIAARYDKIHRFDVQLSATNVHRESRDFTAGDKAVVAALPGARLGMTICYDVRFPHLHRDLARAGADILSVPAAFNSVSGAAHWHVLLRARAIETGSFVIAPAQCGVHEDGRKTFGHSLIVSPWGEIIAEAGDAPGVILADLDLDQVASARGRIPALQHDMPYALAINADVET